MEVPHNLTFLRTYADAGLFIILSGAATFEDAMDVLDTQFKMPLRIIYARHEVKSFHASGKTMKS